MALADSLEELETLDVPRGVVAAANRYANKKIDLVQLVNILNQIEDPKMRESIHAASKAIHTQHFDAFVAGGKWAADFPEEKQAAALNLIADRVLQASSELYELFKKSGVDGSGAEHAIKVSGEILDIIDGVREYEPKEKVSKGPKSGPGPKGPAGT